MGCGESVAHTGWWALKIVWFVLACFVFSVIFWATEHWLNHHKKKKKK